MIIGWDVDGTLCDTPANVDYDDEASLLAGCKPRIPMLMRVGELAACGHVMDVVTARGPGVQNATLAQLGAWLPDVQFRHVHHRPRLVFDAKHYVQDKADSLRRLGTEIYIGDRHEDRAAALTAGARFLWHWQVEARGLAHWPAAETRGAPPAPLEAIR